MQGTIASHCISCSGGIYLVDLGQEVARFPSAPEMGSSGKNSI